MHADMLTRDEVRAAIARESCRRPPLMIRMWIGQDCYEAYGDELRELVEAVPEDLVQVGFVAPAGWEIPEERPEYRWAISDKPEDEDSKAIDARRFMPSWDDLDEYLEKMPDPSPMEYYEPAAAIRRDHADKFVVGMDFFCFYERLWTIRGMAPLLLDMMVERENLERLMDAVMEYHLKVIRGYAHAGVDAYYTSDDLGTQTGLFFNPNIFRELFKPRYKVLIDEAHSHGVQFWLHTCGDVSEVVDDFIEIGLDVLHPIQRFAMDPEATAERFGGQITFMPGIDVQQLLPWESPEAVVEGTKRFVETFARPEGGFIASVGNAIHTDTSMANLRAFMETVYEYSSEWQRTLSV